MSRTTALSPADLTIGQKVSLSTSVTWPTVAVGPVVSRLDLTVIVAPRLGLSLNLILPPPLEILPEPSDNPNLAVHESAILMFVGSWEEEDEDDEEAHFGLRFRFTAIAIWFAASE